IKILVGDILEKNEVPAKYYLSERYLETLKNHRSRHESKGNGFGYTVLEKDGISNAIVVGGMGHERNLIFDDRLTNFEVSGKKGELNREFIRKMTPREWARLQGFPESYDFSCVSDTQAYKQFGNSVAIPAVRAVAEKVLDKLGYIKEFEKLGDLKNIKLDNKGENEEMAKDTLNKGEWSEVYAFMKIAGDATLDIGDANLETKTNEFYKVYRIIREDDNRELNLEDNNVRV
ncbi:MAG: HpaII family restriction endonuclease, partial [Erysipelotrichaceae bacterium]